MTWNGRFFWNKRGEANLTNAIQLFDEVRIVDPGYAPGWSGLADAYIQLGYGSYTKPSEAFPRARFAAEKAAGLDNTMAEPHATLGFYHLYYEWN